jgi:uncharacterized protein YecT (DUF1311 family)
MRVRIVLLSLALAATSQSADEKQSKLRLATAPSEEYALEWTQPRGPLRVVSAKDSSVATELDVASFFKTSAEKTTSTPLPFISPDSSWVFVVGPSSDVFPGSFDRPTVLFHRTQSKDGAIRFEAPVAGRFDKAAWEFLDHEFKLKRTDVPPDAQWVYSADFIDWSRDSGRLLVRVTGGAWSESKGAWVQPAADSWYCYFNTRSGKFELTDRLRFADTRPERNEVTADENAGLIAVVTNAESIGEEGSQRSPKERFDQADKRLNDIYGKLINQTESAKREALREEQRAWLVSLDTDAKVAAIQAWSFGREADARVLESKATSTEARVTELEKRLAKQ